MLSKYNRHNDTCPDLCVSEATVPKVLLECHLEQGAKFILK